MKLRNLILAGLLGLASLGATAAEAPKYVFYFIGDGMGLNPIMTAQAYNRDVLGNSDPLLMMQFPVASWAMSYSASSPITDSAAAGTALSTGHKTRNGMVGMTPDSAAVNSVARVLKDNGYGVGVVTSVGADDATPAAFYAHAPYRKLYRDIDLQAAQSGYDFIAGAGFGGIKDNPEVKEALTQNGVQLVWGAKGVDEIAADRVLLLADSIRTWNIGYTIDSISGALNLPLITRTAMKHLARVSPERYFLMVEGGNIDHALHANDAGAAIKEILNFNQALAEAYNFYLAHPDETLIVVTADHDTGGMSHVASRTKFSNPLSVFDYQRVSKEAFSDYCKSLIATTDPYSWEDMRRYLADNLGLFSYIPVSEKDEKALREAFDQTFNLRNSSDQETLYASFNAFAVSVFNMLNDAAGTIFTTTSHSGNMVPVFAVGVGADEFRHPNNNTDLPRIMATICGVEL